MRERAKAVADSLAAARSGSLEALGQTLDGFRAYLLAIAEREVDPQLKAKGGASDLVQETLLRALANIDSFQPGSNMPAWLFTILRNLFRSDYRKRRREVEDADGSYAKTLKSQPSQSQHLEFEEFRVALEKLPQDQKEALILVGASGFSYEDAAAICGCAVGTIKSRVNRARSKLSNLLYVQGADDFGPDNTVRAVIGGSGR